MLGIHLSCASSRAVVEEGLAKRGRAIFIGRFQPFHKGHLEAVKQILEEREELVIVIGSAQFSHTYDNPFTAGERIEMIRIGLGAAGIDLARVLIVPVPDVGEHRLWVARLKAMLPRFDAAYTNNAFVKLLLEEEGIEVVEPRLYNRGELSATNVRRLMLEGQRWRDLVQREVADYIESIGGPARMKTITSGTDRWRGGPSRAS